MKVFALSIFTNWLIFLLCVVPVWATDQLKSTTVEEIRFEAMLSNSNSYGKPLPLVSLWNNGLLPGGFNPAYQLNLIEQGHYLLPTFQMPGHPNANKKYYESSMKKMAQLKLPFTLVSTQWESLLTSENKFFSLPPDKNPNVVNNNNNSVIKKVSPFGPVRYWKEVGKKRTDDPLFAKVAEWYPDPPLIIFLSNNEHDKLRWHDAETSKRYMSLYGSGKSDEFKRKLFGDQWIERYGALINGIKENLPKLWAETKTRFVGYDAFGQDAFCRYHQWIERSLYSQGRFEPWPKVWGGTSSSFYVHNWDSSTDYTVMSPLIRAMNYIFMLDETKSMNPDFWFELSIWDGHLPGDSSDMWQYYVNHGQAYSPTRYAGMAKFGMWLLRPRVLREFRLWDQTVSSVGDYFVALAESVDMVHENAVLRKFWRQGSIVVNTSHKHPHQSNVPLEYQNLNRWFLLDTSLDPPWPWTMDTEVPVFSIALLIGSSPKREWLVYAFSPLQERNAVKVLIPGYKEVQISATPAGTYWYVREDGDKVDTLPLSDTSKIEPPKNLDIKATQIQ